MSDDPWAQHIFHPQSPYAAAIAEADRQIQRLPDYLGSKGKLDTTLFVIMGDSQSPHGWHLALDPEAALTPMIFSGPGMPPANRFHYFKAFVHEVHFERY